MCVFSASVVGRSRKGGARKKAGGRHLSLEKERGGETARFLVREEKHAMFKKAQRGPTKTAREERRVRKGL